MLRVDVIDTDIGIESHALPRLFRTFEQGDASITLRFGGLALGLAISRYHINLEI
jgi:signal transduction histidine kinase